MKLSLIELNYNLTHLGITGNQSIETHSRIKIINKFNLLCISYSIAYIAFTLSFAFYQPAVIFIMGLFFYALSLYCNKVAWFTSAKVLILVATNFSVFYLSLYYGFGSGFHLYYFTSPLIVFSLFDISELNRIIYGFLLYLLSLALLVYLHDIGFSLSNETPMKINRFLYPVNIFLALSFCLLMVTHFSEFNKKINKKLLISNAELEKKQSLLEAEIVERKNTEEKLSTLLKDKETLLSETHHRVKNNLAVVSGMLDLQALMAEQEEVRLILNDSRGRIKSMSLIHESLYKHDNVSQIEFGAYIRTLVEEIKNTHSSLPFKVNVVLNTEEVFLSVTKAIPCGLLVNEVMTNSFKHAFAGRSTGEITVSLSEKNHSCYLSIKDNGKGIGPVSDNSSKSIGMTLIAAFVKQLKGEHTFVNEDGTLFSLIFNK
jgi:two-component sensor histidine kinase